MNRCYLLRTQLQKVFLPNCQHVFKYRTHYKTKYVLQQIIYEKLIFPNTIFKEKIQVLAHVVEIRLYLLHVQFDSVLSNHTHLKRHRVVVTVTMSACHHVTIFPYLSNLLLSTPLPYSPLFSTTLFSTLNNSFPHVAR